MKDRLEVDDDHVIERALEILPDGSFGSFETFETFETFSVLDQTIDRVNYQHGHLSALRLQLEAKLLFECDQEQWLIGVSYCGRSRLRERVFDVEQAVQAGPIDYWPTDVRL